MGGRAVGWSAAVAVCFGTACSFEPAVVACAGDCDRPHGCVGGDCARCVGDDCAAIALTCADLICEHGACVDDVLGLRCLCEPGWAGDRCNTCSSPYLPVPGEPLCGPVCGAGLCTGFADCTGGSCVCETNYVETQGVCRASCSGFILYPDSDGVNCDSCDDSDGFIRCACPPGYQDDDGDFLCEPDCVDCGGHGTCEARSIGCSCATGYQDFDGDLVCELDCSGISCNPFEGCGVGGPLIEGDPGAGTAACRCVVYVDADATGSKDGSSWQNAFTDLQSALDEAVIRGDQQLRPCEVWLAEGTYDASAGLSVVAAWEGLGLYGGFAGTERHREQREPRLRRTSLDGFGSAAAPLLSIVDAEPVVIDGIELRGGRGSGGDGGALYLERVWDTFVRDVLIYDNDAVNGGGLAVADAGVVLERVGLYSNDAQNDGGALFINGAWLSLYDTELVMNQTGGRGGGMAARIVNGDEDWFYGEDLTFVGNVADQGGAVATEGVRFEMVRTLAISNEAVNGGAVLHADAPYATFYRAVVVGNRSTGPGAVSYGLAGATIRWMDAGFAANQSGDGSTHFFQGAGAMDLGNNVYPANEATVIRATSMTFQGWTNLGVTRPVCDGGAVCADIDQDWVFRVATPTFAIPAYPATGIIDAVTVGTTFWGTTVRVRDVRWRSTSLVGALALIEGAYLPIIASGDNWFRVLGPVSAIGGETFELLSLKPSTSSPVIDAASIGQPIEVPDMDEQRPWDNLLVDDSGEGVVPFLDVGPYEYRP